MICLENPKGTHLTGAGRRRMPQHAPICSENSRKNKKADWVQGVGYVQDRRNYRQRSDPCSRAEKRSAGG